MKKRIDREAQQDIQSASNAGLDFAVELPWKDWPETLGQNFIYLVNEKHIFVGTIEQDETSGKLTIWNGGTYYMLREPSENFRFKQIDWPQVRQGI